MYVRPYEPPTPLYIYLSLHRDRFERLAEYLDSEKGHFLEDCQRYADMDGRFSDGSPFESGESSDSDLDGEPSDNLPFLSAQR